MYPAAVRKMGPHSSTERTVEIEPILRQKMKIDIKTFNFEFASKFTQSLRTQDRENGFPVNI